MVDVSAKAESERSALAAGMVRMKAPTRAAILEGRIEKGAVLEAARLAGIMAAKRTSDLIPLCHPLPLSHIEVSFENCAGGIEVRARARARARTGVEMEALAAVGVACLTIYDMAKAVERGMRIENIRLLEKRGGSGGVWTAR